ncbi:MAG: hypothetical protein HQL73_02450 [Magnetococcales bacterium]|nr:hypothetical protein [Magnetococcales bacterium]
MHGFLSQGYITSSDYDYYTKTDGGTFNFNELGVNFSWNANDRLRLGGQLVSRGLGEVDHNDIKVDWALADYHWEDWLGLRLGRIKIPNGLFNEVMDVDAARSQILPPGSVYNLYYRDLIIAVNGLNLYGNTDPGFGNLEYSLYVGKEPVEPKGGLSIFTSLAQGGGN